MFIISIFKKEKKFVDIIQEHLAPNKRKKLMGFIPAVQTMVNRWWKNKRS